MSSIPRKKYHSTQLNRQKTTEFNNNIRIHISLFLFDKLKHTEAAKTKKISSWE